MRPLPRFALFVAVSLATRWLGFVVEVLDVDEAAHIVGSWQWLAGGVLYRDFVDNKPPLLYVYYAAAQVFAPTLYSVRWFTALVTVPLTALGVSAYFDHDRRGLVAGLVFLAFSASFLAHDMVSVNAELPMLLPATWALVLVRRSGNALPATRLAGAAALVGVASLVKYQAALWLAGLLVAGPFVSWRARMPRRALRETALIAGGFAVPLLATWGWFVWLGAGQHLLRWTIGANLAYLDNPWQWGEVAQRALGYFAPFLLVTAPLWWAAVCGPTSPEDAGRQRVARTTLLASLPAAFLGLRFFPHYFVQCDVPLALASAPTVSRWLHPPSRSGRRFLAWVVVATAGTSIVNGVLYLGSRPVYRETDGVYKTVGRYLSADPCARNATLFVWGWAPSFYYYSRMKPASRFAVLAQSGLTDYVPGNLAAARGEVRTVGRVDRDTWDLLLGDLERNRATFVLDTAPANLYRWGGQAIAKYPRLGNYLAERFDLVATVERVNIYRRRGCAARPG